VRQFYPVAPAVYRQLLAAKPMYLFLNRLLASPSLRAQRVRTEAGRVLDDGPRLGEIDRGSVTDYPDDSTQEHRIAKIVLGYRSSQGLFIQLRWVRMLVHVDREKGVG
jgi:hypothetical protein